MTFKGVLQNHQRVPLEIARTFLLQIISRFCHYHKHNLLHGDITQENVLIDAEKLDIKLRGFDVARPMWSLLVDLLLNLKCIFGCLLYQILEY